LAAEAFERQTVSYPFSLAKPRWKTEASLKNYKLFVYEGAHGGAVV